MTARLAVDIGGTFTDAVFEKDGVRTTVKVLTTPSRPAEGFMQGVQAVLAKAGADAASVDLILHGATLATNALIERKGAKTALITTEGHRDSLEMAFENRFDQYDIQADRPPPLVGRGLRLPVTERMNFRGEVLVPLDEVSVRRLIPVLEKEAVESIAVGLLHAYANPAHERRAAEILAGALPDIPVSLSSSVCPEIREYERQSTTVANAYVQPKIAGYLEDVKARLGEAGFTCPCLLMTSAGSLVTIETASRFPVRLVESGPAGGAVLAAHIARVLGEDSVVSFDMGGTTAKICLIDNAEPLLSREFEIGRAHRFMKGSGTPVKIPVIEMVEIGAGGGSTAGVDHLGRIQVGPESAGSEPGPACYGLGGARAAVTDANLILGRLDPAAFAGGSFNLDAAAAAGALDADVGGPLGLDTLSAAKGVIEIVDENMAAAARVHAAERGCDLEDRTMIAFGGGAPIHAARLAEKLGVKKVIVPENAGVGSAVGFLLAPAAYEVVRSRYARLSALDWKLLDGLFSEMEREAEDVVRLAAPDAAAVMERHGYARYVGQGHEIKIALPGGPFDGALADEVRAAFESAYKARFGLLVPDMEIEVLTWSVRAAERREQQTAPKAGVNADAPDAPGAPPAAASTRLMHEPGASSPAAAAVIERAALGRTPQAGPAVVQEPQTAVVVPKNWSVSKNQFGDLVIAREPDFAPAQAGLSGQVRMQVLWDRLISIVEEQAQAIIRSAFSTTVREAGDLSAGVFDPAGRMLAQAVTGTPGHVNAMAASVGYFLDRYPPETMRPGDVFVTNDPWLGTGHLFDFTVVSPVFRQDVLTALFASTVHVVDIGGAGFSPDSGQVFEEGLCIPIMRLFNAGEAAETVFEIVRANVREPVQVTGDLYSLASSNAVGARRLLSLMDETGIENLDEIGAHIISVSERAMIDAINALPPGRYENEMTVDGYGRPVALRAVMNISHGRITVDYAGTSPVSPFGINVPLTYAQAYTSFGVRSIVGHTVPNNMGSLKPIEVTAPAGCILNAQRPCAVNVRHVIGQMLPDVVLGCLDKAAPGSAPAEGSSSLWNPMLSGGHGVVGDHNYGNAAPFSVTVFHSGGAGARPGKPGLSATAFPSGVRNTPVEITESISPLIYRRKEYRENSGGAGTWRGGDGQIIEIEHSEGAPFALFALFDRIDHPARGRGGGANGLPGAVRLAGGKVLKGKGKQIVPAGERLILELPGGGGLGKSPV